MTIGRPQPGDYARFYQTYLDAAAPPDDARELLARQGDVLAYMATWSEDQAGHRYAEGKWTVTQVVGHMADTERVFAYRLLRIARGDTTPLPGFDENAWQQQAGFESRTLASVVSELAAVRKASLALIRSLDEAALARTGTASEAKVKRARAGLDRGRPLCPSRRTAARPLPDAMIALAGGVIGAAIFLAVLGPAVVDPTNLGWTMRHDLQTYVLAWTHFRHEPWQWPPGAIPGVGHPVGSSIGNTDAIPLAALALKPLQAVLPEPFQYLGAWLLLCFVLQGVFAVLLMRLATTDWRLQLLGATLFVQTPTLFNRTAHPALCAHFLLLASIGLTLDGMRARRPWHAGAWIAVAAVVAATQPYLAGMVLALALAALANRAWQADPSWRCLRPLAVEAAALVTTMGVVFWLCGYFLVSSAGDLQLEGVGLFSMNLLGPVMGMGYTTLLPELPLATPGQYEGHVYFGVGWMLVALAALAVVVRGRAKVPRLGLGWLAVLACTLLALSPVVTLGRAILIDLTPWAPAALATFRSSGRFGWVAMYVTFALAALVVASGLPKRAALAVLAIAVVVQAVDMRGAYANIRGREHDPAWTTYDNPLRSAAWEAIVPVYRHLVMVPPDMCATVWPSAPAGPHLPFSLLAGGHGVTINSGNAGRYDMGAVRRYCAALEGDIRAGRVDDDSVYVLSPALFDALAAAARVPLACGPLDGVEVCTSAGTWGRWRQAAATAGFTAALVSPAAP
ncbi:MAG: DUF6311 domain-containing protein [Vicinamibacterales bacterium]